jgi:uncharacterized membrane-anchored protein
MNRRLILLIVLGVVVVAQLAVPLSMIQRREMTLKKGDVLRFKTAPVDPYDAFRGRYVALSIDNEVPVPEQATKQNDFRGDQRVYVLIDTDADGFSRLASAQFQRPETGLYLCMRTPRYWRGGKTMRVSIPFDRYYMNEELAPEAERLYAKHTQRDKIDAYVQVRTRNGFAVLEELYVADMPIHEFMQKNATTDD